MGIVSLARLASVALLIAIWYRTQSWIGQRIAPKGLLGDKLHEWSEPLNRKLHERERLANGLLIVSSLGIDCLALSVMWLGIFGPSFRPIVGLFAMLILRQSCQFVSTLPAPAGMIWRDPGFPSLFVTYGVTNDLFFSGHTAFAVYGALVVSLIGNPMLTVAAVCLALFEILTVLVLRAHWTMDIYAGAATAVCCFVLFGQ
jgi:membrane-associated phospholipid phosphatase